MFSGFDWLLKNAYGTGGELLSSDELKLLRRQVLQNLGKGLSAAGKNDGNILDAFAAGAEGLTSATDAMRSRRERAEYFRSRYPSEITPDMIDWFEQDRRWRRR